MTATRPKKRKLYSRTLPERLKAAGPVRSIALAAQPPFSIEALDRDPGEDGTTQLTAEDSREPSRVQQFVVEETVGAGYFATLSEPMMAGREFEGRDQRSRRRIEDSFSARSAE